MSSYEQMPGHSRVWIYQASSPFAKEQLEQLKTALSHFIRDWTSHNQALRAWGDILHQRFIVIMVDESQAGASGCSIDKSVAFVKQVEAETGIELFDRWNFAYKNKEQVHSANKDDFEQKYKAGEINDDTIVFNNLVNNKTDFESSWQLALKDSWHKNFV